MEENGIAPLTWEGKRSAAAAPDAEVVDKPTRRRFSPSYKLRVVEEADRCTEPGEVGRLLRREGLYSSHLTTWRKAVRSGWLRALSKRRGRKPSERNPLEGKVRKLERENTRLEKELGTPFASVGLARLTRLSAWWIRLGIRPETIEPGKPQQNGRHERMHRTLKREATRPPKANLSAQQRHFNDFRHTFNHIRPHEALDDATPDSVYRSALRAYPDVLPPIEYPEHFEVRKVSTNGGIRWHSRWINISSALGNEFIGLEPIGPALWQVYFGPTTLGWFDEELFVIFDTHGNTGRNPIC